MVLVDVGHEHVDGAAFSAAVADQDDRTRGCQHVADFFVEGEILRDTVSLIMRLFSMHQMMMEVMRIVGFEGNFVLRSPDTPTAKYVRRVMIDDHDHAAGGVHRGHRHLRCCGFEETSQARYFFDPQFSCVGTPEEFTLRTDDEGEFPTVRRSDLPDPLEEFESIAPMQASRQLAMQQSLMKNFDLVVQVLAHSGHDINEHDECRYAAPQTAIRPEDVAWSSDRVRAPVRRLDSLICIVGLGPGHAERKARGDFSPLLLARGHGNPALVGAHDRRADVQAQP